MVLTALWGPLGVMFGGLRGVLKALWELFGVASWEFQVPPMLSFKALCDPLLWGASLGHRCLIILLLVALTLSESLFISALSLSVSILNSQAGLPTFKIIDFS